jgi:hypothetical protein
LSKSVRFGSKISEHQALNSHYFIISQRMSIARRHGYVAVPQQMLNCDKIDSGPHEATCKRMTKIMKPQMWYLSQSHGLHKTYFRITEALARPTSAGKDKLTLPLLPQVGQQLEDDVIHGNKSIASVVTSKPANGVGPERVFLEMSRERGQGRPAQRGVHR